MTLGDTVSLALRNLRQAKLRTGLTMLGVSIGIASLAGMVSLGVGLQEQFVGRFTNAGLFDVDHRHVHAGADRDPFGPGRGRGATPVPFGRRGDGARAAIPQSQMRHRPSRSATAGARRRRGREAGGAAPRQGGLPEPPHSGAADVRRRVRVRHRRRRADVHARPGRVPDDQAGAFFDNDTDRGLHRQLGSGGAHGRGRPAGAHRPRSHLRLRARGRRGPTRCLFRCRAVPVPGAPRSRQPRADAVASSASSSATRRRRRWAYRRSPPA